MPDPSVPSLDDCLSDARSAEFARFILVFSLLFLALLWAYQELHGGFAYRHFLDELTVRPSAALIGLLDADANVHAAGHRLEWSGGRLSVLNGCDGADAMMVLISVLFASSLPWRTRLFGALAGVALVHGLNLVRISALYYAFRHDRSLFELVHGILGPLAIIAFVLLFVLFLRNSHERAALA